MVLVGSKADKQRAVSEEEALRLATKWGSPYCEVSAKTRQNVRKPFVELVDSIVADEALLRVGSVGTLSVGARASKSGGCAC